MVKIKVLDCTLRDGGYINSWKFSYGVIQGIVSMLEAANVEIIEVGFLDESVSSDFEGTKFGSCDAIKIAVGDTSHNNADLVAMIMVGAFSTNNIPNRSNCILDGIRVCFKKNQISEALRIAEIITEKGYDLYMQPASVTDYSEFELIEMLKDMNQLKPKAVYIVDTYGLMQKDDVKNIFDVFDGTLDNNIEVGFHSHNNLQLSFSNSQELIEIMPKRTIIIDSCVFGMGRGAGNLCTELIVRYINENIYNKYNLLAIMEIIDCYINPLFKRYSWGYSVPFYVAAIAKCHPNYATFLANKQSLGINAIHNILVSVPENKKRNYDEQLIQALYIAYQENDVNDVDVMSKLSKKCKGRKVLLFAPGKSISNRKEEIKALIKKEEAVCIAVNFWPEFLKPDICFFCNRKRYEEQNIEVILGEIGTLLVTSNIVSANENGINIVNYNDLINPNHEVPDVSGAMALRLLIKLGVEKVFMAGFDGFSTDERENYYKEGFGNIIDSEANEKRNLSFKIQLNELAKQVELEFITPSIYDV